MDILHPVGGLIRVPGHPLAAALIGRVKSEGNVAVLRQNLGIFACHLFFHPAIGMGNHDAGIRVRFGISCRDVHIGGDFQAVQVVRNGKQVHFARSIFGDRAFIHQTKQVVIVAVFGFDLLNGFILKQCHVASSFIFARPRPEPSLHRTGAARAY